VAASHQPGQRRLRSRADKMMILPSMILPFRVGPLRRRTQTGRITEGRIIIFTESGSANRLAGQARISKSLRRYFAFRTSSFGRVAKATENSRAPLRLAHSPEPSRSEREPLRRLVRPRAARGSPVRFRKVLTVPHSTFCLNGSEATRQRFVPLTDNAARRADTRART
jgi:hypothetical protein